MQNIDIPSSVKSIGYAALANTDFLTVPSSAINIGGAYMFYGCSKLNSIELPKNMKSNTGRSLQ